MPKSCTACGNVIQSLEYLECTNCKKLYDLLCLTLTKEAWKKNTQKHKWICPSCTSSRPKGDNSLTPVRPNIPSSTEDHADGTDNVNTQRGSRFSKTANRASETTPNWDSKMVEIQGTALQGSVGNVNLREILDEIKKMREEIGGISDLRKEIGDLRTQALSINAILNETLLEYKRKLDDANREISSLKCIAIQSQKDLEFQEQIVINDELEIVGIPEENNESLINVINITTKKLGVELDESDISYVARVGPRPSSSSKTDRNSKPRPILVKLVRRLKKNEIIQTCKAHRKLTTEGITAGPPKPIYINERLTRKNRQLFREARLRARQHDFKYCWTRNGYIFVRQADNKPATRIDSAEDLDVKIGPTGATSKRSV